MEPGPSGPESEPASHSGFARRTQLPKPQEGVPRNKGTGEKVTMSAGCAQALIGAVPRRRFGYFAAAGKVTSPLIECPSGEGNGTSTSPLPYGREAKRSFAESFFAYFFLRKK